MTDDNRHIVEERINELIKLYFDIGARILCDFVLVLMFEYIAAFACMNTEKEIHQREIVKKLNLSVEGLSLVNLLTQIRNFVIHEPQKLDSKYYVNFARYLSDEGINDLVGFYLDPSLAVKFLNSFRERYLPMSSGTVEESNIF